MSLCFQMLYTFWSLIITKGGWFSGLKLLQKEKTCLESLSSLKQCFSKPLLRNHEQPCSFSKGSTQKSLLFTPHQMAGLFSTLLPSEFISMEICLVASPTWSASVLLSRGTDPEAVIHLGSTFPLDCQPDSDPGGWWFKLKQTWTWSKPLVLICRKTL